jgi:hypothetical protein
MNARKIGSYLLGASMVLFLSACAPGQLLGPTFTPTPSITPTITPSPTMTPTPAPTLTLGQSASSVCDGKSLAGAADYSAAPPRTILVCMTGQECKPVTQIGDFSKAIKNSGKDYLDTVPTGTVDMQLVACVKKTMITQCKYGMGITMNVYQFAVDIFTAKLHESKLSKKILDNGSSTCPSSLPAGTTFGVSKEGFFFPDTYNDVFAAIASVLQ